MHLTIYRPLVLLYLITALANALVIPQIARRVNTRSGAGGAALSNEWRRCLKKGTYLWRDLQTPNRHAGGVNYKVTVMNLESRRMRATTITPAQGEWLNELGISSGPSSPGIQFSVKTSGNSEVEPQFTNTIQPDGIIVITSNDKPKREEAVHLSDILGWGFHKYGKGQPLKAVFHPGITDSETWEIMDEAYGKRRPEEMKDGTSFTWTFAKHREAFLAFLGTPTGSAAAELAMYFQGDVLGTAGPVGGPVRGRARKTIASIETRIYLSDTNRSAKIYDMVIRFTE